MLPRTGVPSDGLALELRGRKVEEGMENGERELLYIHGRKRSPSFYSLRSQKLGWDGKDF